MSVSNSLCRQRVSANSGCQMCSKVLLCMHYSNCKTFTCQKVLAVVTNKSSGVGPPGILQEKQTRVHEG